MTTAAQSRAASVCSAGKQVPFPADLAFVVASSGFAAAKTGSAMRSYNDAAASAAAAASALGFDTLGAAVGALGEQACRDRLSAGVGRGSGFGGRGGTAESAVGAPTCQDAPAPGTAEATTQLLRFNQFARESGGLVPGLAAAIAAGDGPSAARLAAESHALGAAALGNLVGPTEWLPRRAVALGASAGSSAFGAGFGGSVWALAPAGAAQSLCQSWQRDYAAAFPEHAVAARFFVMRPGPGACRI